MRRLPLILALYPNMSGLCYTVFEGHLVAIDWGIKTTRSTSANLVEQAEHLVDVYTPEIVVLPARRATSSSKRLQVIAVEIEQLASKRDIIVHSYTRTDIQACFAQYGATSKDAVARVIAFLLPEFEQHLPPIRKLWMSEDYRMGIFDAVSLAMTYYVNEVEAHTGERATYDSDAS